MHKKHKELIFVGERFRKQMKKSLAYSLQCSLQGKILKPKMKFDL